MSTNTFAVHSDLANPAFCCSSIAITPDFQKTKQGLQAATPQASLRNGTVTFVKFEGKHFAITCKHVVECCRELNKSSQDGETYSLRTMLNGFYMVADRFFFPKGDLMQDDPDIAIREISPHHIDHIGKRALDLDKMGEPSDSIRHAIAAGFPEGMKYETDHDGLRHKISLPQVHVLAELSSKPASRFVMRSELDIAIDRSVSYSGMSGGPIFWSNEDEYGLLGIVYEGEASEDRRIVTIFGELATPEAVRSWILQAPS